MKQSTYKLLVELAGKVDGSFGAATSSASGQVGKLQGLMQKLAKYAAIAFAVKKVIQFGVSCANAAMELC